MKDAKELFKNVDYKIHRLKVQKLENSASLPNLNLEKKTKQQ